MEDKIKEILVEDLIVLNITHEHAPPRKDCFEDCGVGLNDQIAASNPIMAPVRSGGKKHRKCMECWEEYVSKLAKQIADLYYEPKGDEEGLVENPIIPDPRLVDFEFQLAEKAGFDKGSKAQKRLDDINKEKEIEEIKKETEGIMEVATKRIDALQGLLIFYRIGKRPTEKLFNQLEKTEKDWQSLKSKMGVII